MTIRFIFYCNILMLLTSIHHVYGAFVYDTPWRLHVLAFSIPVIIFNVVLGKRAHTSMAAFYVLITINFFISIGLIGLFEGIYNHGLKNILFFSSTSAEVMNKLFPPPKYVMPDDLIFEATGVLQGVLAVALLYYFVKTLQSRRVALLRRT